jgi:hypothetical protein
MTAAGILENLNQRGIRLVARGAQLIAQPASRLSDDDREAIRQHKAELHEYLHAIEVAQWCESSHIDISIGAAILDIEAKAFALGWSYERLWNSHFGRIASSIRAD